MEKVLSFFTPAHRKAIYRIASAILLILTMHGLVTADEAAQYLQALAMLLGVSVAELAHAHVNEDE